MKRVEMRSKRQYAKVMPRKEVYEYWKRMFDLIFAALLLMLLSPLIVLLAVLIRADSVGPAFFVQERVGREGERFLICKLRTMHVSAPHGVPSALLRDRERHVTRIGRFLRSASLDELPQLWNVLLGEMSFVGPRPVIPAETALLRYREILGADRVRPGLTGLAQVCGRDVLSDRAKAMLDAQYAATISLHTDLRILMVTIPLIVCGVGND